MNAESAIYLVQGLNLFAFVTIAVWFVVPRLRNLSRINALVALVSVHLGRTLSLQIYSSQAAGMQIPNAFRDHVVIGDLAGWALAIIILFCLRYRPRFSVSLIWLLIAETVLDLGLGILEAIHAGVMGSISGTTWLIVAFYVPFMQVALGLTVWQLLTRRSEQMTR